MKNPFRSFVPPLDEVIQQQATAPLMGSDDGRRESLSRERMEARQVALKRPGDQPLRGYVGNTLNILNSTYDAYSAELAMLEKDIAKLNEDRRQLVIAMAGVVAALNDIKKENERSPAKIVEVNVDEAQLSADIARALDADEANAPVPYRMNAGQPTNGD